ncbi:putative ribonuclease h protein [Quercus suber]|uniref:Ribonuclease h protein n=1 Tax=Quercus suber TaxID=58331 RepID=A0AAW0KC67_QUESU
MEEEGHYTGYFDGDWIWKAFTISKIKCFVWLCYHKSVPVNTVLVARGMDVSPVCQLCREGLESILHVLRDCQIARNLWNSLSPPMPASLFFGLNITEWIRQICCNFKTSLNSNIRWDIIFCFGIWTLWLNRNGVVFRNESGQ